MASEGVPLTTVWTHIPRAGVGQRFSNDGVGLLELQTVTADRDVELDQFALKEGHTSSPTTSGAVLHVSSTTSTTLDDDDDGSSSDTPTNERDPFTQCDSSASLSPTPPLPGLVSRRQSGKSATNSDENL